MKRTPFHARLLAHVLPLVLLLSAATAAGQVPLLPKTSETTPVPARTDGPTTETLATQLAEAEAKLAALTPLLTESEAAARGTTLTAMQAASDRQKSMVTEIRRALGLLDRIKGLRQSSGELEARLEALRAQGPDEKPPYTIEIRDKALDEAAAKRRELENEMLAAGDLDQRIEKAAQEVADAGKRRRAAQDAVRNPPIGSAPPHLEWELESARIEESSALVRKSALELEREAVRLEIGRSRLEAAYADEKASHIAGRSLFTKQDLDRQLVAIDVARDLLSSSLPKMRDQVQVAESRRTAAAEALNNVQSPEDSVLKSVELAAATAWAQARSRAVELAEKDLALYDAQKELWRIRYEVGSGSDQDHAVPARERAVKILESIATERTLQEARLAEVRRLAPEIDKALADAASGPSALKKAQENRKKALTVREEAVTQQLARLATVQALAERVIAEIEREQGRSDWRDWLAWSRRVAVKIWGMEILVVGESGVTVRKIVIALLIFLIGTAVAKRATRLLRVLIFPRLGVSAGTGAAVQKLVRYALTISLFMFALKFASIPLTLFAFLGGALAVALGFGTQQIVSNFISGIILLVERPIRVGDLIEFSGTFGIVEEVGTRCTRMRTFTNINLLIPNSALVQNTVINWSLANHQVRMFLPVHVTSDSPNEDVMRILGEVAAETPGVLKKPVPRVFLADITPSFHKYEIHYWIEMYSLSDRWKAESALRVRIIDALREADIKIAAPPVK